MESWEYQGDPEPTTGNSLDRVKEPHQEPGGQRKTWDLCWWGGKLDLRFRVEVALNAGPSWEQWQENQH